MALENNLLNKVSTSDLFDKNIESIYITVSGMVTFVIVLQFRKVNRDPSTV